MRLRYSSVTILAHPILIHFYTMPTLMKKILSLFLVCLFPFALFAAVEKPEGEKKKFPGFPSRGEMLQKI
jgi:hypothetical protein